MFKKLFLIIFCLFLPINFVFAVPIDELAEIKNILNLPEEKIDIAVVKLTIDKIIDPSIDINLYLNKLDKIYSKVQELAGDKKPNIKEINKYLYEPGPWNNYQVYSYNLDDPLGKNLKTSLLSTYLDTKKGNCVTMPILYYLIARKFNWGAYLARAPRHMYIKALGKDNKFANIEATHKGIQVTDECYIKEQKISKRALATQLYMQALTSKEVVANLLTPVMSFYMQTDEYDKALYICDLSIKCDRYYDAAYANKWAIYYKRYNTEHEKLKGKERTFSQQDYLDWLFSQASKYRMVAEEFGWREVDKEDEEKYLEDAKLEREKSKDNAKK